MATLSTLHVIKLGSQSWTAPESLVHQDSDDQLWLQISCTNYGLCKLLCQSHAPAHPNMKSCPGVKEISPCLQISCKARVYSLSILQAAKGSTPKRVKLSALQRKPLSKIAGQT